MIPRPPGVKDDWGKANDDEQKREYWRWRFAGQIAEGFAANMEVGGELDYDDMAHDAVMFADALIAELEGGR